MPTGEGERQREELRRCSMMQGHYDKGQSIISVVPSPYLSFFPSLDIKGIQKQNYLKLLKQTQSGKSPHSVRVLKSSRAAPANYNGIIILITKVTV